MAMSVLFRLPSIAWLFRINKILCLHLCSEQQRLYKFSWNSSWRIHFTHTHINMSIVDAWWINEKCVSDWTDENGIFVGFPNKTAKDRYLWIAPFEISAFHAPIKRHTLYRPNFIFSFSLFCIHSTRKGANEHKYFIDSTQQHINRMICLVKMCYYFFFVLSLAFVHPSHLKCTSNGLTFGKDQCWCSSACCENTCKRLSRSIDIYT